MSNSMLVLNNMRSTQIHTFYEQNSNDNIQETATDGSSSSTKGTTEFDIKAFKPVNLSQHDNKTFVVAVDQMETDQSIFSAADVLALQSKQHQVRVFYYGELRCQFYNYIRDRYSDLPHQNSERYSYDVQFIKRMSTEKRKIDVRDRIRPAILDYVKERKPKFIVCGIQGGLTAGLLGSESDISFRQLLGSTPIICKKDYVFKKMKGTQKYEKSSFAFRVDFSENAMHSFKLMMDHIRNGDAIHLIWVKPQRKVSVFGNESADESNIVFKPFKDEMKKNNFENVEIKTHIFFKPNVGECLLSVVNNKEHNINFLVVYCDLMMDYAKGKELIGSVADYCVRYCKCPVIVPKL